MITYTMIIKRDSGRVSEACMFSNAFSDTPENKSMPNIQLVRVCMTFSVCDHKR